MLFKAAITLVEDRDRPFILSVAVPAAPGRFVVYEFRLKERHEALSVLMEYVRMAYARAEDLVAFHEGQVAEYQAGLMQLSFDRKAMLITQDDGF